MEISLRYFALVAPIVLAAAPVAAQSPTLFTNIEARLKQCSSVHPDIPGSASCEHAAFVAADTTLNTVYRNVIFSLRHPGVDHAPFNPQVVHRLVMSERAWLAYRPAECDYRSAVAIGAPLEGFEYQQCLYVMTKERVSVLTSPDAPQNAR